MFISTIVVGSHHSEGSDGAMLGANQPASLRPARVSPY